MKAHPILLFLYLFQGLQLALCQPACSSPAVYTSTTAFACTGSNNFITPAEIPNFPLGSSAITILAYIKIVSLSGGSCRSSGAYPMDVFSIYKTVSGVDRLIAAVGLNGQPYLRYRIGKQDGSEFFYDAVDSGNDPFKTDDWVEMRISIDFANNKAIIASTFAIDFHFDAPDPNQALNYNTGWTFDSSMKFYFGGRPSGPRSSVLPSRITVWNTYLPISTTASGTIAKYPGNLMLGNNAVLIKEFLLKENSGPSISDTLNLPATGFLGTSSAATTDTSSVTSPSWSFNRALKFTAATQYIRIPAFTVAAINELVLASMTLNFWLKITTAPGTSSYIFRFSNNAESLDRFSLKHDSALALSVCSGGVCGSRTAPLTANTWQQITVSWVLRNARTSADPKCYYTIHINNVIITTGYFDSQVPAAALINDAWDKVYFRGFIGLLGQIQIYSPGALQIFKPSWCTSTCVADLGAANPPICTGMPVGSSCDATCGSCLDATATGCLTCAAGKKFYKGKCETPCPAKTYTDTESCVDCSEGCDVCTSSSCTTCSSGYYPSGATCTACTAGCNVCTSGSCSSCGSGHFPDGSGCSSCSAGCDTCSDAVSCTSCKVGYYDNGSGGCGSCSSDCDVCTDNTHCTTCKAGFHLYDDECYDDCPVSTYEDTSATCADCSADCEECTSSIVCTKCSTSHYLTPSDACADCSADCDVCTDNTHCTTCSPTFYLYDDECHKPCPDHTYDDTTTTCADCPIGCDDCTSTSCSSCLTKYYLSSGACFSCSSDCDTCTDSTHCTVCSTGFYLYDDECHNPCPDHTYDDTTTTCADCPIGCDDCTSTSCSSCLTGYYLFSGACPSCSSDCDTCTDSTHCTVCSTGFYLYDDKCFDDCPVTTYDDTATTCADCPAGCDMCPSASCTTCSTGYYSNGVGGCLSCSSDCDTCTDNSHCTVCSAGFYLYQDTCHDPCPPKTYTATTACVDCSTGCDVCTNTACTTCGIGYYLSSGVCLSCSSNCDICTDALHCTTCHTGFYLYGGQCYSPCPSQAPVVSNDACVAEDELEGAAAVNKAARSGAKRAMKAMNMAFPFSTMPFVYGALSKSLSYTRYMNISRSDKLEKLYSEPDDNVQMIPVPTLSEETKSKFAQHRLPEVFERYELPSSFLVNFGDDIMAVVMFIGLMIIAAIVKHFTKYLRNIRSPRFIAIHMKTWLQNYVIGQVFESFGDVVFYGVIEWRTLSLDDKYAWLSFIACLVCLAACIIIFIVSIWVIRKYQKNKKLLGKSKLDDDEYKRRSEKFNKKYEAIQLLYEDFKDENFTTQAVIMYFGVQNVLFSLIITLLYDSPLTQCMLLIIMDGTFLVFLAAKRAIKSTIDLIEIALLKLVLLMVNVSLLVMASVRFDESNFGGIRDGGSGFLVGLNMMFTFLPYVFMTAKLGMSGWEFYKSQKEIAKAKEMKRINGRIKKLERQKEAKAQGTLEDNFESSLNNLKNGTSQELTMNISYQTNANIDNLESQPQRLKERKRSEILALKSSEEGIVRFSKSLRKRRRANPQGDMDDLVIQYKSGEYF